ncbi:hypothetical protein [Bradyrhizobium yuanmingense]|uniref:hypothetical protein n=1 Tax=Bradyrhizobium yuanmingense TaxID=108015 RepID=UPI0012E34621|nr:hypothetical protein [Bradyrhizobium yuanmingense]
MNENRGRAASYNEGLLVIGATQTRSSDGEVYRRTGKAVADVACRTISTPLEQSDKFISRQMACFYNLHQLLTGVVDRTDKLYISPERWPRSSNETCNCHPGWRLYVGSFWPTTGRSMKDSRFSQAFEHTGHDRNPWLVLLQDRLSSMKTTRVTRSSLDAPSIGSAYERSLGDPARVVEAFF